MGELPAEEELLAAVGAAGWLLEHTAVRVLDAAEMHPRAGWAFQDPDEPTKSRELDVWSYRQMLRDETNKVFVTARFLVECKQSTNPYVGVGHVLPEPSFKDNPTAHVLPRPVVTVPVDENTTVMKPAWSHFGFHDLARPHFGSNFRVTQLTRLDRAKGGVWDASNSGVFTSLVYPLAKALAASTGGAARVQPAGYGAAKRHGWVDFALHFPVVLLSCPLYVVDASSDRPVVDERPWVTARRELKSENVKGVFDIDVVTERAFADYVADRLDFVTKVADVIGSDPLKYTGEDTPPS